MDHETPKDDNLNTRMLVDPAKELLVGMRCIPAQVERVVRQQMHDEKNTKDEAAQGLEFLELPNRRHD